MFLKERHQQRYSKAFIKGYSKGHTLIELMIALLICSFLMLGCYGVYQVFYKQWLMHQTLSQVQNNIRLLHYWFKDKLTSEFPLGVQKVVALPKSEFATKEYSDIIKFIHTIEDKSVYLYLADTKRVDASGKPVYGLYQYSQESRQEELFEGIDEIHYRYGVLNEGKLRFLTHEQLNNAQDVIILRVIAKIKGVDYPYSRDFQQDIALRGVT